MGLAALEQAVLIFGSWLPLTILSRGPICTTDDRFFPSSSSALVPLVLVPGDSLKPTPYLYSFYVFA
jgi:hypothetical protein